MENGPGLSGDEHPVLPDRRRGEIFSTARTGEALEEDFHAGKEFITGRFILEDTVRYVNTIVNSVSN